MDVYFELSGNESSFFYSFTARAARALSSSSVYGSVVDHIERLLFLFLQSTSDPLLGGVRTTMTTFMYLGRVMKPL